MTQRLLPPGVKPDFPLGEIVITVAAFKKLAIDEISVALGRHARCDWGDVDGAQAMYNQMGLKYMSGGPRSTYHDRNGTAFWIITDDNWKTTTVLLPDDY